MPNILNTETFCKGVLAVALKHRAIIFEGDDFIEAFELV